MDATTRLLLEAADLLLRHTILQEPFTLLKARELSRKIVKILEEQESTLPQIKPVLNTTTTEKSSQDQK